MHDHCKGQELRRVPDTPYCAQIFCLNKKSPSSGPAVEREGEDGVNNNRRHMWTLPMTDMTRGIDRYTNDNNNTGKATNSSTCCRVSGTRVDEGGVTSGTVIGGSQ